MRVTCRSAFDEPDREFPAMAVNKACPHVETALAWLLKESCRVPILVDSSAVD